MTSLLDRPTGPRPSPRPARGSGRSVVVTGVLASLAAAAGSLVAVLCLVLAVWVSDARTGSSASAALRLAGQGWLLLHGADVRLLGAGGGAIGLTPWLLSLVPALLLGRASGRAARALSVRTWPAVARLTAAVVVGYCGVGLVVAGACAGTASAVVLWQAPVCTGLLALVAGGTGVVRASGLAGRAWRRIPGFERSALVGAAGALVVLVAGGAAVLAGSLAAHAGVVESLAGATDPGVVGTVALLAVELGLVPTAVVWGAAWTTGAGFAVGASTAVSPFGVSVGAVPALPLLAAVPSGRPGVAALLALAVPLLAGLVAALLVSRREQQLEAGLMLRVLVVLGVGVAVGTAVLCAAASGAMGPGRLAVTGPPLVVTTLSATFEVTFVAGLALAGRAAWLRRRERGEQAAPTPTDDDGLDDLVFVEPPTS